MRTIYSSFAGIDSNGNPVYYKEMAGESTDTKPTDHIATGSVFLEVDTGSVFCYSEDAGNYVEQFSLQG